MENVSLMKSAKVFALKYNLELGHKHTAAESTKDKILRITREILPAEADILRELLKRIQ